MTGYRWLLFDADNTLFDFDAAEEAALTRTLTQYGLSADEGTKGRYRAVNAALWAAFDRGEVDQETLVVERFARFLAGEGKPGDAAEWNRTYLDGLAQGNALLPGAEALCRALAGRYVLALATNGVPRVQRRRLEMSPLAPLFGERVYISGELGCRKPEWRYFEKVLAALGAEPRETLVIGDSLSSDIQGAANAGLDSVWLNLRGKASGAVRPTYEVPGFGRLAGLLGV